MNSLIVWFGRFAHVKINAIVKEATENSEIVKAEVFSTIYPHNLIAYLLIRLTGIDFMKQLAGKSTHSPWIQEFISQLYVMWSFCWGKNWFFFFSSLGWVICPEISIPSGDNNFEEILIDFKSTLCKVPLYFCSPEANWRELENEIKNLKEKRIRKRKKCKIKETFTAYKLSELWES